MYKTVLMDGGVTLYQGTEQVVALIRAQSAESEAIVYSPDGGSMIYNPDSGWRQL